MNTIIGQGGAIDCRICLFAQDPGRQEIFSFDTTGVG
jgi:hypothetical protein